MKKIIIILAFILILTMNVLAEDGMDSYTYDDMDYTGGGMEYTGLMDYTGGAGIEIGYLQIDQKDFVAQATAAGYPALADKLVYYGGSSLLGARNGIRCGVFNYLGEAKTVSGDAVTKLNYSAWGFNLEYGYVIKQELDIAAGLLLGGSTYELTLKKNELASLNNPNKIVLSNSFFTLGPKVILNYKVNPWLALRGSVGYLYGIGSDQWKDEKTRTSVVPALAVRGLVIGITAQVGY